MRIPGAMVSVGLLAMLGGGSAPAIGSGTSAHNGRIVFQASVGKTRQLFTIKADGTGLRQVTQVAFSGANRGAEQPDWSPDGSRIVFDAPSGKGTGIFTIRADGTGLRALHLALGGSSAAPAYSPDGGELAFDHSVGPSRPTVHGIFVAAADGSNPRRVTTGIATAEAYDTAATWSPDGTRICFTRVRNSLQAAIYVVKVDGSGLERLTPWSLDASAASWAPDGSKLVFESFSTPHPGKSANLFTISPDGGAMTQLTHFSGGAAQAFGPAWSPDGQKIVWHKIGPQVNQLFLMDSHGGNQRQLTRMPGDAKISHPDWGTAG
jgi:Tol biopolymer transport system component